MQNDGPHPAITPRTRARARHILDHYYIGPARNADVLEIWGYTPDHCYSPGDEVSLPYPQLQIHGRWKLAVTAQPMNV